MLVTYPSNSGSYLNNNSKHIKVKLRSAHLEREELGIAALITYRMCNESEKAFSSTFEIFKGILIEC